MNNKANITSAWQYPKNMQTKIFAESQLDSIIHSASTKTTIDPYQYSPKSVLKLRRNKRIKTDGIVLKNIIKNQIWNPLIRHRYSSRSKSLQNTHKKQNEKLESLGLVLSNYRMQNITGDVTSLNFSHNKSLVKLKQQLMPFFTDIKMPSKIKRQDSSTKTNNSTDLTNQPKKGQQSSLKKNIGLFKIHQIEWRYKPKPSYKTLQEELVENQ